MKSVRHRFSLIILIFAFLLSFAGLFACVGGGADTDLPDHVHNYVFSDNGDGTHTKTCSVCGQVLSGSTAAHIFGAFDDEGYATCIACEAVQKIHDHAFTFVDNGDGTHTEKCYCGKVNGDPAAHTFGAFNDDGFATCTACGLKEKVHDHDFTIVDNGDGTHSEKCSCGKVKDNSTALHTFGALDDEGYVTCTVCRVKEKRHEHVYNFTDNGDGTHSEKCSCGKIKDNSTAIHVLALSNPTETTHKYSCSVCGYETLPETCIATGAWLTDGTYHWKVCSDPNCTHKIEFSAHANGEDEYDDVNHWKVCSVCGETITATIAAHALALTNPTETTHNYVCSCGYGTEPETCIATGVWLTDGTYHWKVCSDSNCTHKIGFAEHIFGAFDDDGYATCETCDLKKKVHTHAYAYADNGDGTHDKKCSCGKVLNGFTAFHNNVDGVCSVCGHIHVFVGQNRGADHEYVCACGLSNGTGSHNAARIVGEEYYCSDCSHLHEIGGFDTDGYATCSVCSLKIKVHEHNYVITDKGNGTHAEICTSCSDEKKNSAAPHDFAGENFACSVCGHQHALLTLDSGSTHYTKCSVCEQVYSAPAPHDNVDGVCSVCGHVHSFVAVNRGANHEYVCSCGTSNGTALHNAETVIDNEYYCSDCSHKHSFSGFDAEGYATCSVCSIKVKVHTHAYSFVDKGNGTHEQRCACGNVKANSLAFHDNVSGACSACGHVHVLSVTYNETTHGYLCSSCNRTYNSTAHTLVYSSGAEEDSYACSFCGYEIYSLNKVIDKQTIDLNITTGAVNTTKTYTFTGIPEGAGQIESIKYGDADLGTALQVKVSGFGLTYGDGEVVITTRTEADNRTHEFIIPVLIVTKLLTSKTDIINLKTYADKYNGAQNDGIYDGYFMLGGNINFNGNFTTTMLSAPGDSDAAGSSAYTAAEGFRGVFDGNGKTITGLRLYSDDNKNIAFITKLAAGGVIKNVRFDKASVGGCSFVCVGGLGTIENVYVKYDYFGCNENGDGFYKLTTYTTTFINKAGSGPDYITIKNCVVDLTADKGYTSNINNASTANSRFGHVIGAMSWRDEENILGVFVVGGNQYTRYIYKWNQESYSNQSSIYPTNKGNWNYYQDKNEFLYFHGEEIAEWNFWDYENGALRFNGTSVISGTPAASLSTAGRLIVDGDKSSDYIVVYEQNIPYSVYAATFVTRMFYRATGNVSLRKAEDTATAANTRNGVYYADTVTDGIILNRTGSAVWNDSACYIVIGNKKIIESLGIVVPKYSAVIKKIGNSYIIAADRDEDYEEAVRVFLSKVIGFMVYSDILVSFDTSEAINAAPYIDMEFLVGSTARAQSGGIQYFKADVLGYETYYYGPNNQAWHNTFVWLPFEIYGEDHAVWYSNYGTGEALSDSLHQLCYTAHGNAGEYDIMVKTVAEKIAAYVKANPTKYNVAFTHQDNRYFCECAECNKHSPAFSILKFIDAVCDYISERSMITSAYTVNFFAYKKTMEAPTEAEFALIGDVNPHVGLVIAPIEAYYAQSVYAPDNAFFKDSMDAWNAHVQNIGCWFYQANYANYLFPWDTFKTMLTWIEYAAATLHTNWLFIQGISNSITGSAFHDFKEHISSRAGVEIMTRVNPHSTYSNEDEYMDAIDAYFMELVQDFFGVRINGTSVTLDPKGHGYYGPAGVEMLELFNAQNALYRSSLALLKADVENNYANFDNSRIGGWTDIYTWTDPTGLGSCRDHIDNVAFYTYRAGYGYVKVLRSSGTYHYVGDYNYYTNTYYPYITRNQIETLYGILARATKKLSDAYAGNYDDVMYAIYNNNIVAESLFARLVACTATVQHSNLSAYGMRTLYYTYTYKGVTTTETEYTKWQHFKDDMDSLCIDRLGEDMASWGVYNGLVTTGSKHAGIYHVWANYLQINGHYALTEEYTTPKWFKP